jgi:AraC-like DNA-binding protein
MAASQLTQGGHTGELLEGCSTRAGTVAEWAYSAGHAATAHAHAVPFVFAVLTESQSGDPTGRSELDAIGYVGFCPAGVEHTAAMPNQLKMLHSDLDGAFLDEIAEYGKKLKDPVDRFDPYLFNVLKHLRSEIWDFNALSDIEIETLIGEICVSLGRKTRPIDGNSSSRWLKRLMRTIDEQYREDIALEDLAADAKVHPVHLSRVFHKFHGETLRNYIRRMRIRDARRLLQSTSLPIAEIAAETGYYDESHFSKAFKMVVGTTPGKYRQIVRS